LTEFGKQGTARGKVSASSEAASSKAASKTLIVVAAALQLLQNQTTRV
jgi:hypothetical protein